VVALCANSTEMPNSGSGSIIILALDFRPGESSTRLSALDASRFPF
jgi:hypothetical protein